MIIPPPVPPNPSPNDTDTGSRPPPNENGSGSFKSEEFPILAVILPIAIIIALILLGVTVFCCYKRCKIKSPKQEAEKP